ncbi:hypothetical protein [Humidisolicoccus flavus]|uniref:hypothetical protein n=1 Tax=Humidisolicoccus flavus TaxID=3111414 RepID=UPI00324E5540
MAHLVDPTQEAPARDREPHPSGVPNPLRRMPEVLALEHNGRQWLKSRVTHSSGLFFSEIFRWNGAGWEWQGSYEVPDESEHSRFWSGLFFDGPVREVPTPQDLPAPIAPRSLIVRLQELADMPLVSSDWLLRLPRHLLRVVCLVVVLLTLGTVAYLSFMSEVDLSGPLLTSILFMTIVPASLFAFAYEERLIGFQSRWVVKRH